MFENIYWIIFWAVIALAVLWLAVRWIKEPREGKERK